jgi:hypothetical protein
VIIFLPKGLVPERVRRYAHTRKQQGRG